jgi:predicted permease
MKRARRALGGLDDDIREHIELETQENIDRGMSPEEARRQALLKFGNVALVREDTRAVWVWAWLEQLGQDLRYALRMLRRTPAFAVAVILTLALGIGANTAIFSLLQAIMLRSLPVHAADELYFVAHGTDRSSPSANYPYFERVRARTDLFAGVATYLGSGSVKVSVDGSIDSARAQFVSGNYHRVIGVTMALGRGFTADDDPTGARLLAVVISDGYWARRFGRDPQILGRTLTIDGRPLPVVGVTAAGFDGLDPGTRVDVTLPLAIRILDAPDFQTNHGTWLGDMPIVVRLESGVGSAEAGSATEVLFQGFLSEPANAWLHKMPGWDRVHASLIPANRGTAGLRNQYAGSIQLLMAMVGIVLLIGCANVANLLVARGTARAKEVAVRMSVGAGRLRLVRQLLTESLLLSLIGGLVAFGLARVSVDAIGAMVGAGSNPIYLDLRPDASVLAFTLAVSMLTGLLFGLAPAVATTRLDMTPALKATGTTIRRTPGRWSPRQVLISVQVGLCVLLVSGAGLLGRTLRNLETRPTGIDRHDLLLFSLDARGTPFPAERVPALCEDLVARMVSRAGVISGSCSRNIPINSRGNARPLEVPGAPPQPVNARMVFTNMVTPDYFRTFGIGVVSGRVFSARDAANAQKVAIVNRALARFFFGEDDPVGLSVHFDQDDTNLMTIVGVVEDATQRSLREESPMTIYTPLAQLGQPEALVTVALRAENPSSLAGSMRAEVGALTPDVVVDNFRTMEQQIGSELVRERLLAMLSAAFAGLAVVLSCVGLYGMVSYDVSRSLRDLGIRMALGAQRLDVLRQIIRGALLVSSIGISVGLVAALAGTRVVASLLFGVTARDPMTLAGAAALLMLTTLMASYLPARRTSRIDPALVLRSE